MENLLEFSCVVYLTGIEEDLETKKYEEMGLNLTDPSQQKEERIVKYSLDASKVVELKETFIRYRKEWHPACYATFIVADMLCETPPLFISYEDFKKKVNGHYKESS